MTTDIPLEITVSPRHHFGKELRRLRTVAGLSQKELAVRIPMSVSNLSMVETGARAPSPEVVTKLDQVLDIGTTLSDLLARLDRASSQLPRWFRPWLEFEREATALHLWELALVPGLLQTREYALALSSPEPGVSPEQAEERVSARIERQAILDRPKPPLLWVVLDEGVLHRPIGSPKVMYDQLSHLMKMGEHPNVSLQILPFSALSVVGLLGGFAVAELPASTPMAYAESQPAGNRITERPDEVRGLALRHSMLRADSHSRRESLGLIEEKMKLWTT